MRARRCGTSPVGPWKPLLVKTSQRLSYESELLLYYYMKHALMMVLGCGIPLLLIFVLPLFGVSSSATFSIFIVLMVACHVIHFAMMGRHGAHGHGKAPKSK